MCKCNPSIRTPFCGAPGCKPFDDGFRINTPTESKSFNRMAEMLDSLGVKNNMFFLATNNDELIGVDPHSKDLDNNTKNMIIEECVSNPWYFIRECVRIPTNSNKVVPFELNIASLAMMYSYVNNIDSAVIVPRRHYITTSASTIVLWAFLFRNSNSILMVDNIIQGVIDFLPPYIRELIVPKARNVYTSKVSPGNELRIGVTLGANHGEKKYDDKDFRNRTVGNISARIYEGGHDPKKKKRDWAFWVDHIFDWDIQKLMDYVSDNSSDTTSGLYIHFDFSRLDKDTEWFLDVNGLIRSNHAMDRDILCKDY